MRATRPSGFAAVLAVPVPGGETRPTALSVRVSAGKQGLQGDDGSDEFSIDPGGRPVASPWAATTLVPGAAEGVHDVLVRTREKGDRTRCH